MENKRYFKRPCKKCGNIYRPTGKYQSLCDKCNPKLNCKERLKVQYFKSKEELDAIRHSETLSKWKVLSKSYKLGKRIWGSRFTKQRLAYDMDLPMTTTLRCLALDKATNKSWRLLKGNKISASKLAMICYTKSKYLQDEIVKTVIDNNYSTYQIKSLKINDLQDISKEKLRLATEKGFTRQSSAAHSFTLWIERGKLLLLMRKSALTEEKFKDIKKELKKINKMIKRYVE